jgi:hypothetical protein
LAETLAIVLEVEDLLGEIVTIDERLRHRELTTLEWAEHVIQRQQLVDALPPEVLYGNGPESDQWEKAGKNMSTPASRAGSKKNPSGRAIPTAELITTDTCCRWCGSTQFILISQESTRLSCGCHSVSFQGPPR